MKPEAGTHLRGGVAAAIEGFPHERADQSEGGAEDDGSAQHDQDDRPALPQRQRSARDDTDIRDREGLILHGLGVALQEIRIKRFVVVGGTLQFAQPYQTDIRTACIRDQSVELPFHVRLIGFRYAIVALGRLGDAPQFRLDLLLDVIHLVAHLGNGRVVRADLGGPGGGLIGVVGILLTQMHDHGVLQRIGQMLRRRAVCHDLADPVASGGGIGNPGARQSELAGQVAQMLFVHQAFVGIDDPASALKSCTARSAAAA